MLVGLMADTHDDMEAAVRAFDFFSKANVELVLHAGDWIKPDSAKKIAELATTKSIKVKGVLGNNDTELKTILEHGNLASAIEIIPKSVMELQLDSTNIALYHGDDKVVLQGLVSLHRYDMVITGHTHRAKVGKIENQLLINPGTCSFKVARFMKVAASAAVYDTKLRKVHLIEL